MGKRVTMQNIADALGITKVSVSKALNHQTGISDSLRKKILETAAQMGYVGPKALSNQKAYTFGFIVTKRFFLETDRFYNIIYYHLNKKCIGLGHKLVLIVLNEAEEKGNIPLATLCKDTLDGIFFVGQINDKYIDSVMAANRVPMVALDFYRDHMEVDYVLADNYSLGYQAAMKMIESGHKKIGFVGNIFATSSIADRFFGYLKALAVNNLPIREDFFLVNNNASTGEYYVDTSLPEEMPTGFVCHCEMAAYYLKMTLEKYSLTIPDDVSVVAFDNTDIGHTAMLDLTTFDIGRHEMANTALEVILRRMGGDQSPLGKHYVHSILVERTSVKVISESGNKK